MCICPLLAMIKKRSHLLTMEYLENRLINTIFEMEQIRLATPTAECKRLLSEAIMFSYDALEVLMGPC